ncbi:MAG: hypothetical protein IPM76_21735 [Chloroflexi bacterium]|nr:hypothetical protein [Chloroflexota bacterium]
MQLPNQSRSKLSYYITIIFALLLTALVVASCQKQNEEAVTDNRKQQVHQLLFRPLPKPVALHPMIFSLL